MLTCRDTAIFLQDYVYIVHRKPLFCAALNYLLCASFLSYEWVSGNLVFNWPWYWLCGGLWTVCWLTGFGAILCWLTPGLGAGDLVVWGCINTCWTAPCDPESKYSFVYCNTNYYHESTLNSQGNKMVLEGIKFISNI